MTFPGFETLTLSMQDFVMPSEEVTTVKARGDDSLVINTFATDGAVEFDILYLNATLTGYAGLGEKSNHVLLTSNVTGTTTVPIQLTLNETDNNYFVVTWISGSSGTGSDSESYVYEIGSITDNSGKNSTNLVNQAAGGSDISLSEPGEDDTVGQVKIVLDSAHDNNKVATINLTAASSGQVYVDRFVTNEGLQFRLPVDWADEVDGAINISASGAANPTSWSMTFIEEDKDANIASGGYFLTTIGLTGTDGAEPTDVNVTDHETEDGSKKYIGYVVSDLATETLIDKPSSGLNELAITYHGEPSYAEVFLTAKDVTFGGGNGGGGGSASIISIFDSEVGANPDANMIVIGGSCVNTYAATLLGVSSKTCGADWTTATDVSAGQYLIETFDRTGGKIATLVAGYNEGDTRNAVTALTTQDIDTSVGNRYIDGVMVVTSPTSPDADTA
jgi:hypothetical protein